ncbi:MAG TPA: hypothetical protein DEO70_06120 [Bacteroidales bacterium]|nr:MAG: hypothetical protein A2X11_03770 [Bacteroidetes bacterium GWE2_42_24]OFY29791.1 MAG: hypothetical protein A2X09_13085 [Bacteroidetes bacterium GWF2_43_11]HBZ66398.1 hypothetical protein [Bacteroidales bacterium]
MPHRLRFILLLIILPFLSNAEGTKELMPYPSDSVGRGVIVASRNGAPNNYGFFAVPQATANNRLCFSISSAAEHVYLGMQWLYLTPGRFLIKNSAGVKVLDTTDVPVAGAGYIPDYYSAIAGPSVVSAGGYNAMLFNPPAAGDYFIEFIYTTVIGSQQPDAVLRYFDLTVTTAGNIPIPGRLWSKNWYLSTMGDLGEDVFRGKMYAYSDDQIVTEVNFNGMRPHLFRVGCNPNGCNDYEPFVLARKSRAENSIYPQYKIFINDPDPLLYPTGVPGQLTSVTTTNPCDGTVSLAIEVTKDGTVSVMIDIDPLPGYQPGDVNFTGGVYAGNTNVLTWNGINGQGLPVANGTPVTIRVTYINGLTNLPLYDIEANNYGFIVNLVRPAGPKPALYWDDTNVGGSRQLDGCLSATGCHTWGYSVGNINTVNTWWYAFTGEWPPFVLNYRRDQTVSQQERICPDDSLLFAGSWLTTAGLYSHTFTAVLGCDSIVNLDLTIKPGPVVSFGPDTTLCQNASLTLQSTTGTGFAYLWNTGATTPSITVSSTGTYSLVATAPNGCTDSDTINVTAAPVILPKLILHD